MNPMISRPTQSPDHLYAAALAVAYWVATIPFAAQSDPAAPIELSRKAASKLLLTQVKPEYPPLARVNYIRGQVRMQVKVARSGRVSDAHVLYGHPFLAASALAAIRRWVYRPFVTRAGPTEFQTLVDVNFALRTSNVEHMPPQPERDLTRQVRPPEVLVKPDQKSTASVHLRVLVGDAGEALDSTPLAGFVSGYEAARKQLEQWRFLPARWGNLVVPWYLDVDVPVEDPPAR